MPVNRPAVWFPLCAAAVAVCLVLHATDKRREFAVEFLFSLLVLSEGVTRASGLPWLKFAYFPAVIGMTGLYSLWTVLGSLALLFLLVPLGILAARFGFVFSQTNLAEQGAFAAFLLATAVLSSLIFTRLKKEREQAVSSLSEIRDRAQSIVPQTEMESLSSDEVTSHYFASMLKTDEEIGQLLLTLKKAVFADSANLFVPTDNGIGLRCSTEEKGSIIITGKGEIGCCLTEKRTFAAGEAEEKKIDLGYIKKSGKTTSVMAFPVNAGPTAIGVLTADSARYHAFGSVEQETGRMFSSQMEKVLERERVYLQIKREHLGLKVLSEESSKMLSSLDAGVIARTLCEGAERIVQAGIIFFSAEDGKFRLLHHTGEAASDKLYDLRGTFVSHIMDVFVANRQPGGLADVSDCRMPILPFKVTDIKAIAVIPLLYEKSVLGLFAAYGGRKDFIDNAQLHILKVMCNQASASLANARLHAAIEKMATTDGLTGLNNHRVFQEKLSAELIRSGRTGKPVSLLLTDIDFFKKINDTYGHPVGDQVLKGVSAIIRETVRTIDIPARYGGEEFAIILPETDAEGALQIAERLRKTIGEQTFTADGKTFRITISMGIAVLPGDAKTKEELIEKADQALYHAKHNGRNRCVLRRRIA